MSMQTKYVNSSEPAGGWFCDLRSAERGMEDRI